VKRKDKRVENELRPLRIEKNYIKNVEGSSLIKLGETWVLSTATVEEHVPQFAKEENIGWVRAEYGMLPRSVRERIGRERRTGRIYEIQRIIGRALRGVLDLRKLNGFTITVDCDVLQADGGTRMAAITGGYVALYEACKYMIKEKMIEVSPILKAVAGISLGIVDSNLLLDLTYEEDREAEIDLNIAMTEDYEIVELQVTGEKRPLRENELLQLIQLAKKGIKQLILEQKRCIEKD
jgi:ribonuclease PH